MNNKEKISVIFICMGNICRSPTAHGVFRALVEEEGLSDSIRIDSAGTHAYHVGEDPDHRSQMTARNRGVDLSDIRASQVKSEDFVSFDYVLAMDQDNHANLLAIAPEGYEGRLHLFLDFAPQMDVSEVPDPYFGGGSGFDRVFDLIQAASEGLLNEIKQKHL